MKRLIMAGQKWISIALLAVLLFAAGCGKNKNEKMDEMYLLKEKNKAPDLEQLKGYLDDKNREVRATAIWYLKDADTEAAFDASVRLLESDDDGFVRSTAAKVIGELKKPEGLPYLAKRSDDPDFHVRVRVAEAAGVIGGEEAAAILVKMVQDQQKEVRLYVAEALGKIGSRNSLKAVIILLEDNDWEVRMKAASAAGKIGDGSAMPHLMKLLEDKNAFVRGAAQQSIYLIQNK